MKEPVKEPVKEIEQLGEDIEQAWQCAGYRAEPFAAIAQVALAGRHLDQQLSTEHIFRWVASAPQIPHQPADDRFGEPPIRLFVGRRFYIEALFWTDGTTAIHQHGFSGAFQVLRGGSIHTRYTFDRHEMIGRELLLGDLRVESSELLRAGEVRPITSGAGFIHSLFHLERPSITLVVRTNHDVGTAPQYSYLHPGIAYDPFVADERLPRLLRLLDVLDPGGAETAALLTDVVGRAELGSVVAMMAHWFRMRPADPALCDALLATLARRHRALAASLGRACQEVRRQALIIRRRRQHHRREHRFLLALLLNVGDRERILQFVEQQYPGGSPLARIITWLEELLSASPTDPRAPAGEGGEYDLGEAELKILHHLLREQTPDQIVAALSEEYDDVERQRAHILDLCASLTNSALFRPLFRSVP